MEWHLAWIWHYSASLQISAGSCDLLTLQKQSQWKSPRKHWTPQGSVGGSQSAGLVFQLQLKMHVWFCHLKQSCIACCPSWGGTLYFSEPLFCFWDGAQDMEALKGFPSLSLFHHRTRSACLVCHLAGYTHAVLYTHDRQGEERPEQCTAWLPCSCCLPGSPCHKEMIFMSWSVHCLGEIEEANIEMKDV